jgi:hypothetical protein
MDLKKYIVRLPSLISIKWLSIELNWGHNNQKRKRKRKMNSGSGVGGACNDIVYELRFESFNCQPQ